jgi:hypothetical protein
MEREQEARALYASLTPNERREKLRLRLTYRTIRDRLLDSEDRVTLPRYALMKWLPILGTEAFGLWLVMRDMAQVEAKQSDSWCWPEQARLGRMLGISENTLRKRLAILERHGFIRKSRRRDQIAGRWMHVQVANDYEVFADLPLVEEDSIQALMADLLEDASRSDRDFRSGAERSHCALGANSAVRGSELKNCGQRDERSRAVGSSELKNCALNVTNVSSSNVRDRSFRNDPRVRSLRQDEKQVREALAHEIGETLRRMEGDRRPGPHGSLGLHRRLAYLMPVSLVKRALMATRDSVDDARAGRGTLTGGPSAYFAGTAFTLAKEAGIDLGVKRRATGSKGTHAGMRPCAHDVGRASPATTSASATVPRDAWETKSQLRELIDSLGSKLSRGCPNSRDSKPRE